MKVADFLPCPAHTSFIKRVKKRREMGKEEKERGAGWRQKGRGEQGMSRRAGSREGKGGDRSRLGVSEETETERDGDILGTRSFHTF